MGGRAIARYKERYYRIQSVFAGRRAAGRCILARALAAGVP